MKQVRALLRFAACGLLLCVATASARAADLVVIDEQGLSLKAGAIVDDGKILDLDDGQSVTLVNDDGDTIKLKGPYHQAPSGKSGDGNSVTVALSGLLVQKDVRTSDVGVVREMMAIQPLDPWVVDIGPGNRCVRAGEAVVFRRKTAMAEARLSIVSSDGAWHTTAVWPKGQDRLSAPDELPVAERASYRIDLGEGPVELTLIRIPASMKNDRMRAAWMFAAGCDLQARTLARTIS